MKKETTFQKGSQNVFADLGLPDPEMRLMKAKIVSRIASILEERGLTQSEAAKVLRVDQPKISALLSGKLAGFSMERLIRFLNALDTRVEMTFKQAKR